MTKSFCSTPLAGTKRTTADETSCVPCARTESNQSSKMAIGSGSTRPAGIGGLRDIEPRAPALLSLVGLRLLDVAHARLFVRVGHRPGFVLRLERMIPLCMLPNCERAGT